MKTCLKMGICKMNKICKMVSYLCIFMVNILHKYTDKRAKSVLSDANSVEVEPRLLTTGSGCLPLDKFKLSNNIWKIPKNVQGYFHLLRNLFFDNCGLPWSFQNLYKGLSLNFGWILVKINFSLWFRKTAKSLD